MSPERAVAAVRAWQRDMTPHRLTCAKDNTHRPLDATVDDQRVVLVCPDCGHRQRRIPELVLRAYERAHERGSEPEHAAPPVMSVRRR
jgi:hypothetical protein